MVITGTNKLVQPFSPPKYRLRCSLIIKSDIESVCACGGVLTTVLACAVNSPFRILVSFSVFSIPRGVYHWSHSFAKQHIHDRILHFQ